MIRIFYTFFFTLIFSFCARATVISGTINGERHKPLVSANVYVKNTTNGVNTNSEGKYSIDLKPGKYALVFQCIGYTKQIKNITVGKKPITFNVQLKPENASLKQVVANVNEPDAAYDIIRKAQEKRKFYLNQVNSYSCDVYLKNMLRLDSTSNRWLLFNVPFNAKEDELRLGIVYLLESHSQFNISIDADKGAPKLGILYLSESKSQLNFQKPHNIKEIMYSSKVSGNSQAFSWSRASDFQFNFYDNQVNTQELGSRYYISPIAESALWYYNYKLLGTFLDGNLKIDKIQVIPKREHDPVFQGTIYIIDNSWQIYSTDLVLTKNANMDFIDTLQIKQTFEPVNDTVWMPVFQSLFFRFKVLDLVYGSGSMSGIFKNYKIDLPFPPYFFNNEVLKVADSATIKDSDYWSQIRQVPLSKEEKNDYTKNDNLARINTLPAYEDSTDKERNKFKAYDFITGYNYYRSNNNSRVYFSSPIYHINFNTVEGLNIGQRVVFHNILENNTYYTIAGEVRYGFSNALLSAKLDAKWYFNPLKQALLSVGGGKFIEQVNDQDPVNEYLNTVYSLLDRENYLKVYDNAYVYINHRRELINGLSVDANLSYSDRSPLINSTNYSWASASAPEYMPNVPQYLNGYATITHNTALLLKLSAIIHFKQKYISLPHQKINIGSKYPVFTIIYTAGIPAFGTTANYDLLEAHLRDDFKFGLLGTSTLIVKAGDFLTTTNLSFIDYIHFLGSQPFFAINYLEGFQLVPYYQYSTNQQFFEAHYEHHFRGFIINKIPLLRWLKIQEVAGIHVLLTPDTRYTEVSLGIEHILKIIRIDWVNSYNNTKWQRAGVTVGLTYWIGQD